MRLSDGAWLLAASVLVAGCATAGIPAPYPPPGFAHRVASSHVELYWNCARPELNALTVEGVAINPWSPQEVRFLEFELVGVDTRDHAISHVRAEAPDFLLRTNQQTPFRLDLRPAGAEVRFDLFYQYRFDEGDGNRLFARAGSGGTFLLAQATKRFMARDVCSDSQHRAR